MDMTFPTCKFCRGLVDPEGPRAIINHEYAHLTCMHEDWKLRNVRGHAELERVQHEITETCMDINAAVSRIFHD